jgi:hypothetical protein
VAIASRPNAFIGLASAANVDQELQAYPFLLRLDIATLARETHVGCLPERTHALGSPFCTALSTC